jgi:hypothetical protein
MDITYRCTAYVNVKFSNYLYISIFVPNYQKFSNHPYIKIFGFTQNSTISTISTMYISSC